MIDFRYHLVSIVSIFLALAVGIVLGAGPLQGELGDTLTNEVAGLRQDKAELNEQLSEANAGIEARDSYIGETNPIVLDATLVGQRVAVVVLPGADAAVVDATEATLRSAGSTVVSTTSVGDSWASADVAVVTARDTAVREAASSAGVDVSDSGSVSPRDVLLAALLARPAADATDAVEPDRARAALDTLAGADLLDVATDDFQIADLVVVVAGATTESDRPAQEEAADRWVDLIIALDARTSGSLVAGESSTVEDGVDVVFSVRNDETAREGVSTVDNAGSALGQASIVHGLVQQRAGEVGQYGLADGADAPYAPVPAP